LLYHAFWPTLGHQQAIFSLCTYQGRTAAYSKAFTRGFSSERTGPQVAQEFVITALEGMAFLQWNEIGLILGLGLRGTRWRWRAYALHPKPHIQNIEDSDATEKAMAM